MSNNPSRYSFTAGQYRRMVEAGIFPPGARVELIDGEILEMAPVGPRHEAAIDLLLAAFAPLGASADLASRTPVALAEDSEPHPDFLLLAPAPAGNVHLLVEVADAALPFDREIKGDLYARAGVPEYWLVNLAAATIEIRRRPEDGAWTEMRAAHRGETLSPLAFPEFEFPAEAILG